MLHVCGAEGKFCATCTLGSIDGTQFSTASELQLQSTAQPAVSWSSWYSWSSSRGLMSRDVVHVSISADA